MMMVVGGCWCYMYSGFSGDGGNSKSVHQFCCSSSYNVGVTRSEKTTTTTDRESTKKKEKIIIIIKEVREPRTKDADSILILYSQRVHQYLIKKTLTCLSARCWVSNAIIVLWGLLFFTHTFLCKCTYICIYIDILWTSIY